MDGAEIHEETLMARIRTVKPEFFTHPEVVRLSIPARLLFLSLLTQADDEGRLYEQPRKIAGLAFGDDDKVNITKLLTELEGQQRILRYTVDGKACIQVTHFTDHQRINRPTPSVIPHPQLSESSVSPHGGNGREQGTGNGKEGKGTLARQESSVDESLYFEEFWLRYPRKVGKRAALLAFRSATKRSDPITIVHGVRSFAGDPNLPDEQFIPHPATWLNRDGWNDSPLPTRNGQQSGAARSLAIAEEFRRRGM